MVSIEPMKVIHRSKQNPRPLRSGAMGFSKGLGDRRMASDGFWVKRGSLTQQLWLGNLI